MRKRYRVLIFASLVAALVVPVGYALSVESVPTTSHARHAAVDVPAGSSFIVPVAAAVAAPRAILVSIGTVETPARRPMSDAAQLFGIGTVLFGLAAFVRKAI